MTLLKIASIVCLGATLGGALAPPAAAKKKTKPADALASTPPETALHAYIERVRAQQAAEVKTGGSIWSTEGRLVRLGTDAKAVRLHDVVSIVVTESLAASTDGQVKNTRASNASSGITGLFGKLKASNALQNLARNDRFLRIDGAGTEHHELESVDHIRRRGCRCASERNAGGAGHAAADLFAADTADSIARPGTARRCERTERSNVDGHDGPRIGSDWQGNRERLHLSTESAGPAARENTDFLKTANGTQGPRSRIGTYGKSRRLQMQSAKQRILTKRTARFVSVWACFAALSIVAASSHAATTGQLARVKDVASIEGIRDNQLVGYGLVVGLHGTGDSSQTVFPAQTLLSVLERMGITVPQTGSNSASNMQVKNMAGVFVVATLPPFSQPGYKLDVTVSSAGDARSLEGGILLDDAALRSRRPDLCRGAGCAGAGWLYGCRRRQ